MKLHLANSDGLNIITGYGPGYVDINGERYQSSLVVLPTDIKVDWDPGRDDEIQLDATSFLAALDSEIILLGTGRTQHFPAPVTLRPLIDAGIGFEVMDTYAACRTYNILVAENRRVAAALLV